MSDEVAIWLRRQISAAREKVAADTRHWSEVPDAVYSSGHLAAKLDADLAVLDFLQRAARPAWATYAVAEDAEAAMRRMAVPYASNPGYQEAWRP